MELVKASTNDVNKIALLEEERFSDAWNLAHWEYELNENEFSHTYVIKDGEEIEGYINYWVLFDQATINKVCVRESYSHQGLGDKLVKAALEDIDDKLCLSTSLEVRISNENAIKLYLKNKFKIALVKKGYYSDGEDCYYMLRSIGDKYE